MRNSTGHKRIIRIPLWRHKIMGEYSPPPEEVLGGIRYFRLVAQSLIVLYIRPSLALEKRRKALKSVREKDLFRTLNLYADACNGWLSKIVAVPVATLESDSTLDFEPRSYQVEARYYETSIPFSCQPMPSHHIFILYHHGGVDSTPVLYSARLVSVTTTPSHNTHAHRHLLIYYQHT